MPATKTNLRFESTQYRVSKLAGVSQTAVSMALSGTGTISEETRTRILEVARLLNYYQSATTTKINSIRDMRTCSHNIAINWINEDGDSLFQNSFYAKILHGIIEECSSSRVGIVPLNTCKKNLFDFSRALNCNGVILLPIESEGDSTLNSPLSVPIVSVMHQYPHLASVTVDEKKAMGLVLEHLSKNNHKKIGYIGLLNGRTAENRYQYFQKGFRVINAQFDENLVCMSYNYDCFKGGKLSFQKLWGEEKRRPTAIVAYNDMMALGIYEGAIQLGVKVPEDVSILSFDNINESECCTPRLTTVCMNLEELGRRAARMIIRFAVKEYYSQEHDEVCPSLITRNSVKLLSPPTKSFLKIAQERLFPVTES